MFYNSYFFCLTPALDRFPIYILSVPPGCKRNCVYTLSLCSLYFTVVQLVISGMPWKKKKVWKDLAGMHTDAHIFRGVKA